MIIAIVSVFQLIFSGGAFSFEYIGDLAAEIIKDKDRAKQVMVVIEQADESYETFSENLNNLSEQLVSLNRNYDTTHTEIESLSTEVKRNRMAFLNKYVELRFQLKDLVTDEEWKAMHPQ